MSKRRASRPTSPATLYSLTGRQEEMVREGAAREGGVYIPIMGGYGKMADELVKGGCGEIREVRHPLPTPAAPDNGYSDLYFVPNERAIAMLPCLTCNGRREIGGFQGGAAPGYVTEPCPDCAGGKQ